MKTTPLLCYLLLLLTLSGSKLLPETPERIVFLGGTLISRMEKYGYLEHALTRHAYTQARILHFRNLGWPADDVFGTARSEFGSSHNTRSWQPPEAEEGYGYQVLMQHVTDAAPNFILLGYGSEMAFAETEQEFEAFRQGYEALLKAFTQKGIELVLISPPRQQQAKVGPQNVEVRNQRLKRATQIIQELAATYQADYIDVFGKLIPPNSEEILTENGIHLTEEGYRKMTALILKEIQLPETAHYQVKLNSQGKVLQAEGATITELTPTNRGFRFDLTPDLLMTDGKLILEDAHLVKVDGEIRRMRSKDPVLISRKDSLQSEELRHLIIEKNRLHRYRINPLNKAYIFLFRRHEMGHLAYEMDDFDRLVEEKEELIDRLRVPQTRRYEVELLAPWKSPRDYPDHEVPKDIPEPNIAAELEAFTIEEGFEVNLFAADPMVINPININWDTRGRAWVASSTTYPHIVPGREPNDRIVILEDTDQDGQADTCIVFAEGLFIPHSVMPVPGGAYVTTTTELLFLADTDGDDVADEKRIVYSGFGNADVHHTIHGLRWAPWGDLYFTQSIYINSFIETPYGNRRLNGSGIWQFRPETEQLEVFTRGMVNPWGHAFDSWGQAFGTDGAGGSGPHYLFPGSAHGTAVGYDRVLSGLIPGKPKNTAAEFVSGRHLPDYWQGSLLSNDYRANRTIRYALKRRRERVQRPRSRDCHSFRASILSSGRSQNGARWSRLYRGLVQPHY